MSRTRNRRSGMGRTLLGGTAAAAALIGMSLLHGAETVDAAQLARTAQNLLPQGLGAEPEVVVTPAMVAAQRILDSRIQDIGRGFRGDVGIAVKDIQSGWSASFDGETHFPQQSVSKFWVALTALDKVDQGDFQLGDATTLGREDMTLFHQPIAGEIARSGRFTTTVSDLMHRALQQSDNTANDAVLRRAGGPEAVRGFLEKKGIKGVRFGPGERLMQSQIAGMSWSQSYSVGRAFYAARDAVPLATRRAAIERYIADPIDGATPLGVVDALARLQKGELLSPASTQRLLSIMSNTKTGPQRLKGGLSSGWRLAHKTGTGQVLGGMQAGYNDIGILTAPDGRSYAVAVLIRRTSAPLPERMQMMQNVSRAVINYHQHLAPTLAASSVAGARGAD